MRYIAILLLALLLAPLPYGWALFALAMIPFWMTTPISLIGLAIAGIAAVAHTVNPTLDVYWFMAGMIAMSALSSPLPLRESMRSLTLMSMLACILYGALVFTQFLPSPLTLPTDWLAGFAAIVSMGGIFWVWQLMIEVRPLRIPALALPTLAGLLCGYTSGLTYLPAIILGMIFLLTTPNRISAMMGSMSVFAGMMTGMLMSDHAYSIPTTAPLLIAILFPVMLLALYRVSYQHSVDKYIGISLLLFTAAALHVTQGPASIFLAGSIGWLATATPLHTLPLYKSTFLKKVAEHKIPLARTDRLPTTIRKEPPLTASAS